MHLCRGNFRSSFVSGGYEPVAEILFNTINVHGYFAEYDLTAPAGSSRCDLCRKAGGAGPRHSEDRNAGIL